MTRGVHELGLVLVRILLTLLINLSDPLLRQVMKQSLLFLQLFKIVDSLDPVRLLKLLLLRFSFLHFLFRHCRRVNCGVDTAHRLTLGEYILDCAITLNLVIRRQL